MGKVKDTSDKPRKRIRVSTRNADQDSNKASTSAPQAMSTPVTKGRRLHTSTPVGKPIDEAILNSLMEKEFDIYSARNDMGVDVAWDCSSPDTIKTILRSQIQKGLFGDLATRLNLDDNAKEESPKTPQIRKSRRIMKRRPRKGNDMESLKQILQSVAKDIMCSPDTTPSRCEVLQSGDRVCSDERGETRSRDLQSLGSSTTLTFTPKFNSDSDDLFGDKDKPETKPVGDVSNESLGQLSDEWSDDDLFGNESFLIKATQCAKTPTETVTSKSTKRNCDKSDVCVDRTSVNRNVANTTSAIAASKMPAKNMNPKITRPDDSNILSANLQKVSVKCTSNTAFGKTMSKLEKSATTSNVVTKVDGQSKIATNYTKPQFVNNCNKTLPVNNHNVNNVGKPQCVNNVNTAKIVNNSTKPPCPSNNTNNPRCSSTNHSNKNTPIITKQTTINEPGQTAHKPTSPFPRHNSLGTPNCMRRLSSEYRLDVSSDKLKRHKSDLSWEKPNKNQHLNTNAAKNMTIQSSDMAALFDPAFEREMMSNNVPRNKNTKSVPKPTVVSGKKTPQNADIPTKLIKIDTPSNIVKDRGKMNLKDIKMNDSFSDLNSSFDTSFGEDILRQITEPDEFLDAQAQMIKHGTKPQNGAQNVAKPRNPAKIQNVTPQNVPKTNVTPQNCAKSLNSADKTVFNINITTTKSSSNITLMDRSNQVHEHMKRPQVIPNKPDSTTLPRNKSANSIQNINTNNTMPNESIRNNDMTNLSRNNNNYRKSSNIKAAIATVISSETCKFVDTRNNFPRQSSMGNNISMKVAPDNVDPPNRTNPNQTNPNRTDPNRTNQNRTPGSTKQPFRRTVSNHSIFIPQANSNSRPSDHLSSTQTPCSADEIERKKRLAREKLEQRRKPVHSTNLVLSCKKS